MADPYTIHLDYCRDCRKGETCGVGTILLELKIRVDEFNPISLDTQ